MADGSLEITPGAGATVDTRTDSSGQHRQVMVVGNDGDLVAGLSPWGALMTDTGMSTLFYDAWSTTLDTVDKWTASTTPPTIGSGTMTFPTAAGYHSLRSKDTIRPNAGFTYVANGITLEATAATGAGRFWGLGTVASSPTATSLAQDGVGFEVDSATGNLLAVTYKAGARTTLGTLTRPTDGGMHRYALHFRVTTAYWYIDDLQVPVHTQAWPDVAVVELPALMARFNGTFTGTPVFTNLAHLTADTSRQGTGILDPVVGTRMARVVDPALLPSSSPMTVNDRTVGPALNVNPNAIQKHTYKLALLRTTGPAYVAGTIQWHLSLHHAASATKTVRIRRILVAHTIPPVATTGSALVWQLHRVSAAPTGTALAAGAGTATTGYQPTDGRSPAGEATALSVPSVTSAGLLSMVAGAGGVATHNAMQATLYDWQEGGETMPITLRAGALEGIAIGAVSTAAIAATANINTVSVEVIFTEE